MKAYKHRSFQSASSVLQTSTPGVAAFPQSPATRTRRFRTSDTSCINTSTHLPTLLSTPHNCRPTWSQNASSIIPNCCNQQPTQHTWKKIRKQNQPAQQHPEASVVVLLSSQHSPEELCQKRQSPLVRCTKLPNIPPRRSL